MKKIYSLLMAAAILVFTGTAVFSQSGIKDIDKSEMVGIREGEKIEKDLFIATGAFTNKGEVRGELFCASNSFYNFGIVSGDIIAAASYIRVDGSVGADVRLASERVEVGGIIAEDATIFARAVEIDGTIGRTLSVAGKELSMNGSIGGDIRGAVKTLVIDGVVNGDVGIEADNIRFGPKARIEGDFIYRSNAEISIPEGVVIGKVERRAPIFDGNVDMDKFERESRKYSMVSKILFGLGYVVATMVFYGLFRPFVESTSENIIKKPWYSMGLGFAAIIVIPVAAIILLVTIIGMPLAVLTFIGYGVLLYISKIPAAHVLGKFIFSGKSSYASFFTGMAIIMLIANIPYAGKLMSLIVVVLGIGSFFLTAFGKDNGNNVNREKIPPLGE
ncbi:hypothetical protein SAMN02745945_00965 [Peptoclostridium litorale DSM 5388]|uniref:DUF8173 domain-containing protein n=1 Tax=Peptoclostridium litorale DSM 5388 TaxID=1121324 RepID=A0A069RBZ1_PEPLI|nr:hypothetical protein [Peptoclostridium litorale]KDR93770.1 hypothetical protein CLIT_23c00420 [Peptoclostridium litorale DSM 5388]SIN85524.1 hypothetical protein SAMN02745945_00965 [Peptoclostridium litorale DSM 5388]